jgi:hypothetical protein
MPVNKAYLKYKYRKDFWVKSQENNRDRNSSAETAQNLHLHNPEQNETSTEEVYTSIEKPISKDVENETNPVLSVSGPAGKNDKEKVKRKSQEKLTYSEIKNLLKKEIKTSPAGKLEAQDSRPFPVLGLISVISGGLSVLTGIWTPVIGYELMVPEIMAIYVIFLVVTVGCGIASLIRKERKRGLAIAGLAAAAFSLFLFGIFNLLMSSYYY